MLAGPSSGAVVVTAARRAATLEVVAAAVVFVALLGWLLVAQRRLFLNGLDQSNPMQFPREAPDVAAAQEDLRTALLLTAGLVATYLLLVLRSRRWERPPGAPRAEPSRRRRRAILVLVGSPVLVHLALLAVPPSLSIDAFSYLTHGFIADQPAGNPYLSSSSDVAGAPFGQALAQQGWLPVHGPTPYGPVWTSFERLVHTVAGDDIGLGLLLLKLVEVLAVVGTAALAWRVLGRLRPEWQLRGTLLLLWNPLLMVQLSADGHNDGVVMFLVVLAVWGCLERRVAWAVLALGVASLVKFTPVVLAVPMLVHLAWPARADDLRSPGRSRSLVEGLAAAVAVAAVGWLSWRPYWIGSATVDSLRASGTPYPGWSVPGRLVQHLAGAGDPGAPEVVTQTQVALGVALGIVVLATSWWARTPRGLVAVSLLVSSALLLLTPNAWPWYVSVPIALACLLAGRTGTVAVVVLTITPGLAALLGDLFALGMATEDWGNLATLATSTVPGAAVLLLALAALVALPSESRPPAEAAEKPI